MSTEELTLRRMVVAASGMLYWAGVVIQARHIRKQIGRSPNLKPRGTRERALWLGWSLVVMAWIGQPWLVRATGAGAGLDLVPGLSHPVSLGLGLALVALGYAGTLWSYAAMGNTWRIGVNTREKTVLVCSGPYRWVRHPIYLLQIVMLAGAALLLPTPVSFAILALHYACVLIKATDEEKYLLAVHGGNYQDYVNRTGRLFPRLVRKKTPGETDASREH